MSSVIAPLSYRPLFLSIDDDGHHIYGPIGKLGMVKRFADISERGVARNYWAYSTRKENEGWLGRYRSRLIAAQQLAMVVPVEDEEPAEIASRDGNGAANICSKGRYGAYGSVQPRSIIYLRPLEIRSREKVVVPWTRALGSFAPLEA